ncbi:MAG: mobile mystery protein A [Bauldia sp.]|nr:mobile mystery protein A [Bauldia sp.]
MGIETTGKARKRLDERLHPLRPAERFRAPALGWVRAIRDALGMTGVQFARRLGVSPQSAGALEKSEANGSIRLDTLRRAAEALDCTLVYALVPNASLEETLRNRARALAIRDIDRVAHTMKLEAQETGDRDREKRVEDHARELLGDRRLWDR